MTFFSLLTILLIGLKLAGIIAVSWWLVFTPIIVYFVGLLGFVLFCVIAAELRHSHK